MCGTLLLTNVAVSTQEISLQNINRATVLLWRSQRETEQRHFCTKRSGYDGASIKCREHLCFGVSDGHPQRVLLFCLGGDCLPLEEVEKKSSRPGKDHNSVLEWRVSPQMEA